MQKGCYLAMVLGELAIRRYGATGCKYVFFKIERCNMLPNHNVEPEHAENIPQPEVVVFLLGKLLLAQCIQDVELPREISKPLVAHRAQLHLHDDFSIWDHHRHRSEQDLDVFGTPYRENVARQMLCKH